jgi:Sec-independent protein translocase protein TatA
MMGITVGKLAIILIVFIIIFGGKPLISFAKYFGKSLKGFRKDIDNITGHAKGASCGLSNKEPD